MVGRRLVTVGVLVSVVVHAALALAFSQLDETGVVPPTAGRRAVCNDGQRCPALAYRRPRLAPELPYPGAPLVPQIVPRLGRAERDLRMLPILLTYEDPARVESGINVERDNPVPATPLVKADEARPERRDPRTKPDVPLATILERPPADPRVRVGALERITGIMTGDRIGDGRELGPGDEWAGRVRLALLEEFRVPQALDEDTLRALVVTIHITRIRADGAIVAFEVTKRSSNAVYDTAALQLVQRFAPAEGGALRLPAPDPPTLARANAGGILVTLDGSLFGRR